MKKNPDGYELSAISLEIKCEKDKQHPFAATPGWWFNFIHWLDSKGFKIVRK